MLIKRTFGAMRLAHFSLAFAGLIWVLPFLYYHHAEPITTFYQEWAAAMLGLFAMPLLAARRCWQQPVIPRIVLLPIGLSLLAWLQFALGMVAYLDQVLLLNLYLLWAALLIMLGHRLREELGLPVLTTVLAAFMLMGAELSALAGMVQYFFQCARPDVLAYLKVNNIPGILAGNLAQPNHFANYTTLGLVSLGLLRRQMRVWQVVLLAVPLLFVLTLSGSRSPWLYLLCLAGMAFAWQRRERKGGCLHQDRPQGECLVAVQISSSLRLGTDLPASCASLRGEAAGNPPAYPLRVDKSSLPLLHYNLLLLLGFGLMHFVVQIPWEAGCSGGLTSGERLIAGMAGGSVRLHLWHEAWLIFTQFPLLGAGFGQFSWQHFQLGPVLRNPDLTGAWNNAHNLVLQVAAEMGLAGLFILLGTLALWLWQARGAQRTVYHWWGYGLLAVLAIHSLLEYPLWYVYFLGVAALTLGIFDTTTYRLKLRENPPLPDETPSHSTRLSKNGNQVAGYNPIPQAGEWTCVDTHTQRRGLRRELLGRLSVAAMLLLGLLSLSQMLYLYKYRNFNFEVLAKALSAPNVTDDSYAQRIRIQLMHDNLVAAQGRSLLLHPYVDIFLAGAGWDHVADKGVLNERVMRYAPTSIVVYRQALLLARAGRQAEARVQMERAIWAYPDDFPVNRDKLRALANMDTDPARFPALLGFVLQKHEERQDTTPEKP